MAEYHPQIGGFENAMKAFRRTKNEPIKSTATIRLPFKVCTQFDKPIATLMQRRSQNHACAVMIYLKAYADDYVAHRNPDTFEELLSQ